MFTGLSSDEIIGLVVVYLVLCALVSLLAQRRGGDAVQWFFIPLLISPLLAFLLVVLFPPKRREATQPPAPQATPRASGVTSFGTASRTCPACGTPRTGERFCGKCGHDFWRAADGTPPAPPQVAEAPKRGLSVAARGLLLLVAAGLVVIVVMGVLPMLSRSGGQVPSADIPPAGEIWFGSSFDTTTFQLSGRTDSVSSTSAFAMVAHTSRSLDSSEIVVRVYWNGALVSNARPSATGSGELWGFSPGPLYEAGTWKYEITDIGGNVLASGEITAT